MTERMLKNRIEKLDVIAAQQKALEEQAEAIRNEIKADMKEKGVDEISAFGRVARWKEIMGFDDNEKRSDISEWERLNVR